MFQSIKYVSAFNKDRGEYLYELKDSDFVGTIVVREIPMFSEIGEIIALYQEYSKRKLNVAANLVAYFQWCEREYGEQISVRIMELDKLTDFVAEAGEIKEEIQKYLTLL